ncbi:hypothetical protein HYC85_016142 [Camellia sinensis]|uniref:Uncharacterized protein n=1 Tax=Camellia sinensis TaxID=4442 RepID=A0A7J7H269_CAMSI|nr:hypothetical protein HYC85_016142 [Camellia sinensis]
MYLDIEGETLAWIMAIDGLFLLDFLRNCHIHMKENSVSSSATTAHLVDSIGRKLAHGTVLGDIMMLENQIPIFLLREIVSIQCSLHDVEDNLLPSMLMGFCKSLSPIKLIKEDLPLSQVAEHAHLLDLLYHLIVPKKNCSEDNPGNGFGKLGSSSFDSSERFSKIVGSPYYMAPEWPRKLFRQPFVEQCCWTSLAFVNSCALSWMFPEKIYKTLDKSTKILRFKVPFSMFAYPIYLERQVLILMVSLLFYLSMVFGSAQMLKLYGVPYVIFVMWLDTATYLHHHGYEQKRHWYRGKIKCCLITLILSINCIIEQTRILGVGALENLGGCTEISGCDV